VFFIFPSGPSASFANCQLTSVDSATGAYHPLLSLHFCFSTAPDAKGGGMEVINVDDEDEDEDEVVDDIDAGDDDGNDCGIGVPTPDRGPVGPGPPWPAPSGGCPPATRTTGGSAIPPRCWDQQQQHPQSPKPLFFGLSASLLLRNCFRKCQRSLLSSSKTVVISSLLPSARQPLATAPATACCRSLHPE
jgi:hypothetical protein